MVYFSNQLFYVIPLKLLDLVFIIAVLSGISPPIPPKTGGNPGFFFESEAIMRKFIRTALTILLPVLTLCACGKRSELNPNDPVTLSMWHVYGEQTESPMNRLVAEFNETIGKEHGIIIDVSLITNTSDIHRWITAILDDTPGAPKMPDLFFCHSENAAKLGTDRLLDWYDYFSENEIKEFVPGFLEDGVVDGHLSVLPVSKSTHLLFLNGTKFEQFSGDTGITYDDLATWDGLFDAAAAYYDWSGGLPMCALDYPLRAIELNAMSKGSGDFYTEDGWYDFSNPILKESFMEFLRPIVQGHVAMSNFYANTQIMTGEAMAGIGSSASILYFNDVVTYPDNTTEPMNLQVLPYPHTTGAEPAMTQAGVGLSALKTTSQKAEAASLFAHWLTEESRNFDFVTETGYMPVRTRAFDAIDDYAFPDREHNDLYRALHTMSQDFAIYSEPKTAGYHDKITQLYDYFRQKQADWKLHASWGEDVDSMAEEAWDFFCNIQ